VVRPVCCAVLAYESLIVTLASFCSYVYDNFTAGPRRPGEGTEDEEQGIVSAEQMTSGYDYRMPSRVRQQGL
jgi:hypothetical protein